MNFSISDDVPQSWDHIISAFATVVEYDVEFNNGVPIENVECRVRHGLLAITYSGGDRITDAFAMFAKEMSAATCTDVLSPLLEGYLSLPNVITATRGLNGPLFAFVWVAKAIEQRYAILRIENARIG